jgi:uroporphyrinogen decarboxylase
MRILPRQRVLSALNHIRPDRVPLDFWATPEVIVHLKKHFNTQSEEIILEKLHIDIRQYQPDYIGPMIIKQTDGSYYDPMGVHRKPQTNAFCVYEEYASAPLGHIKTIDDFKGYDRWPNIDDYDFEHLSDKIGDMHKTYYIKIETGGLFELAWALRGYEQFMIDMMVQPEIAHYIMKKLTDFYCAYVDRAMQHAGEKIDMVYTYDDIASQRSLLMSPATWESLIKPYHIQLNSVIKSHGKTVMYHSCGSIYDMIPQLMTLPIDVLNPLQPLAKDMDFDMIKTNFGKEIAFHGGIDIQFLLPSGTPQEVKAAVERAIDILGKDGGFILTSAHYIQADTPIENVVAMYDAAYHYKK